MQVNQAYPMQDKVMNETQQIIAKAWADENFKAWLLTDPQAALRAQGIDLPFDLKLVVHEDTPQTRHFVLPIKPQEELSDDELESVAGGCIKSKPVTVSPKNQKWTID